MDEMDDFLDSLMESKKPENVKYISSEDASRLEIRQTATEGEGIFAKSTLPTSEPICSLVYPTMMAIDAEFLQTTCYHCLIVTASPLPITSHGHTSADLKTCNGCLRARFCGRGCQLKSWHAYHKYECKVFKKIKDNFPPAMSRAVLRVVLLKGRNLLSDEYWNQVIALDSHEQILAGRGRSNLTDMAEGIKHLAESPLSTTMIQRLIFIMKANATELPTPAYGGIGVMLDPIIGKINHSCSPNLAVHRPQHTMSAGWNHSETLPKDQQQVFAQLIPLREIKEGEELQNCYIVPTASFKTRRAKLMEDYFFECKCSLCVSDEQVLTDLAKTQPEVRKQFEQWAQNTIRSIPQQIKNKPQTLDKGSAAMDKAEKFLNYPALYTSGDYPQIAMRLTLLGLNSEAYDVALVNMLRVYFLVNPFRLVGRHTPTETYTIFLLLDILDAVLELSDLPAGVTVKPQTWQKKLKSRGLEKADLIHWRERIRADLTKRLNSSVARDQLVLLERSQGNAEKHSGFANATEASSSTAEEHMRQALKLQEAQWQTALENTGC